MANNEVRKLKVNTNELSSILVGEGLKSISLLTDKEPYYLVGGVATQSYVPAFCRRPTSDIDISLVKPLNYDDFRKISEPMINYLFDKGYKINWKKHSRTFSLHIENKEGEKLLIDSSRRNQKSFEKSNKRLERELKNSRKKSIGVAMAECYVCAPEDIFVPKLVRCISSLYRNPSFKQILPKNTEFSPEAVEKRLKSIKDLREYAMLSPGDLETAERLRFTSDIYDMSLLYDLSKIRKRYLKEVMNDWHTLSEKILERDYLLDFIFNK